MAEHITTAPQERDHITDGRCWCEPVILYFGADDEDPLNPPPPYATPTSEDLQDATDAERTVASIMAICFNPGTEYTYDEVGERLLGWAAAIDGVGE